jgi:hypothetical protein
MNNPMMSLLQQLRNNPAQFLAQRGIQIPGGMTDPNQIIQQLMNSGRVSQQQYEQARQMAMQFGMSTPSARGGEHK